MDSKIVGLRGAVPDTHPVPEVVETLETLLKRARAGEIQALAYATCRRPGDGFTTGWNGNAGTRDPLGGAIGYLFHRFFSGAFTGEDSDKP